jgi:hypothetical protein
VRGRYRLHPGCTYPGGRPGPACGAEQGTARCRARARETEYDECLEAVEDARGVVAGQAAAPRAREADNRLQADTNLPITVEDAFVERRGEVQATLGFDYERRRRVTLEGDGEDEEEAGRRSGRHAFVTGAELEFGLGNGLAATIAADYALGDAAEVKNGELELGGKWNFLAQGDVIPALTLSASVSVPYGYQNDSPETTLGLLASKALGSGDNAPYLHANLFWIHAYNRDEDARANRYAAVLGLAVPVTSSTALMFDVVHEQDDDKGRIVNLVELGLRQLLPGGFVVGVGAGAGFGGSVTDFRALLGLQKEF